MAQLPILSRSECVRGGAKQASARSSCLNLGQDSRYDANFYADSEAICSIILYRAIMLSRV